MPEINVLNNERAFVARVRRFIKRECEEYDAGTLPFEHERYLGELYA